MAVTTRNLAIAAVAAAAAFIVGSIIWVTAGGGSDDPGPAAQPSTTTTRSAEPLPTTGTIPVSTSSMVSASEDWIEGQIAQMELGEKVAQLMIVEFVGPSASDGLKWVEDFGVGGFILKTANNNIVDSNQLRALTADLQQQSAIPLLIAVDQEGGRIDRVGFAGHLRFPSAESFGKLGDPKLTEDAAWATGIQLKALGFNVDFAPVSDVNTLGSANPAIGDRSYGSDPVLVGEMTVAAIRGFQRAGVASTPKHFPGHGRTTVDSHFGLPEISVDLDDWTKTDRVPFQTAVDEGVPMIMVGHIAFPAVESMGLPATLSSDIVGGQLRDILGFGGVIVTDDLAGMDALAKWSRPERTRLALLAGCDLLLNPGDVAGAITAIVDGIESGEMAEEVVDQALRRVLGLKLTLGLSTSGPPTPLDDADLQAIEEVAARVDNACSVAEINC